MRFFIITALLFLIMGATSSFASEDSNSSEKVPTSLQDKISIKTVTNSKGSITLYEDGTAFISINRYDGRDSTNLTFELYDIDDVKCTKTEFALLKKDGTLLTWEDNRLDVKENLDNVISIESNDKAFAVLRADGSVKTWGDINSFFANTLLSSKVISLVSYYSGFVALKENGSAIVWGEDTKSNTSSKAVYSTKSAFVVLDADNILTAYGDPIIAKKIISSASKDIGMYVPYFINNNTNYNLSNSTDNTPIAYKKTITGEKVSATLYEDGSVVLFDKKGSKAGELNNIKDIAGTKEELAALTKDGEVVVWNYSFQNPLFIQNLDHVIDIQCGGGYECAALRSNGSVIVWDDNLKLVQRVSSGAIKVVASYSGFAVLKEDKTVTSWGYFVNDVISPKKVSPKLVNVKDIYASYEAFVALKEDGSVVSWGATECGGDSSSVSSKLNGSTKVVKIYSSGANFLAELSTGEIVRWGYLPLVKDTDQIRDVQKLKFNLNLTSELAFLLSDDTVKVWPYNDVTAIEDATLINSNGPISSLKVSNSESKTYAVLYKNNHSVSAWGHLGRGGDISSVSEDLASGVDSIYSTRYAFAALKGGRVITWGSETSGGDIPAEKVEDLSSGVTSISSTSESFAALKGGRVITWGQDWTGGEIPAEKVEELSSGVKSITATHGAFTALKTDGSVVTWGSSAFGGTIYDEDVATAVASGVESIAATYAAFAAVKNGAVITWGDPYYGADISDESLSTALSSGVTAVYANRYAFAAIKSDGSVVTWGDPWVGGDSSIVDSELHDISSIIPCDEFGFIARRSTDGKNIYWGDLNNSEENLYFK